MDVADAAQSLIPAYGSQQDDVVRDASLIPSPLGAIGAVVDQEVDRSEVEGESSTGTSCQFREKPHRQHGIKSQFKAIRF